MSPYSRILFVVASSVALATAMAPARAQEAEPVELNEAENAFAKAMAGATLVGSFTLGEANPDEPPQLHVERYELGDVHKLPNGQWQMQTRIRYGDKDLKLPLMVPVEWVGADGPHPTPVVVIDNLFFPGAGTYSARVLFHEGHYAGHWSSKEHGGVLFGKILKAKEQP
ncbi:hypothetical protein [Botrimarina mediterranea]|uniref:hypothetical protein n=1 Tax=Botrimarina mediterranea TaxID=2528022 RepID=UPI00118B7732|nr:hypothetical protein K2D_14620 [Planctomycetes bacterium K2D]